MIQVYLFAICFVYFAGYSLGSFYFPEVLENAFSTKSMLSMDQITIIMVINLSLLLFAKLMPLKNGPDLRRSLFGLNSGFLLLNIFFIIANLYVWAINGFALSRYGHSINGASLFNLFVVIYPIFNLIQAFHWRKLKISAKLVFSVFIISQLVILILLGKRLEFMILFAGPLAIAFCALNTFKTKALSVLALLIAFSLYSIIRVGGSISIIQILAASMNEFYLASVGLSLLKTMQPEEVANFAYPQFWYGFWFILPDFISGKNAVYASISSTREVFSPFGASSILVELKLGSGGGLIEQSLYYFFFCCSIAGIYVLNQKALQNFLISKNVSSIFIVITVLLNARNGLIISIKNGSQMLIMITLIAIVLSILNPKKKVD